MLLVLGWVTALQPLSLDMYMPAMPAIGQALAADPGAIQLTLSIALFGHAVGMLVIGPVSDRFGRKPPALASLAIFAAASIGCAIASSVGWLVAMRWLQAVAVVGGLITARSILSDIYEPREMARYMSLLALITGLAPVLAPLAGAFVLTYSGWRAIFWVLFACGAVSVLSAYFVLPETRSPEARAHARSESLVDTVRALFSNTHLVRLTFGGAFAAAVFFTYLVSAADLIITQFLVPPELFGFYFGANAVGLIASNEINRWLLRRFEPGQILYWSLRCSLLFTLILLGLSIAGLGKWPILILLFLTVACFPFNVVNSSALIQGEDRARGGAVAALSGALTSLLGALGSGLSSVFYNGTPTPMAATMSLLAALAIVSAPKLLNAPGGKAG